MAGLTSRSAYLEGLQKRAERLTATAISLIDIFTQEADSLKRSDEASRLRVLHSYTMRQLNLARRSEDSAVLSLSRVSLVSYVGRLALGGIVRGVSKNKRLSTFVDYLLENPADKQLPFGTVLVRIGSNGLPDDVAVASVSGLARELSREEAEIIHELQQGGCLLLEQRTFSLLIEKVIDGIQEGQLALPVSAEELSKIQVSY